MQFWPKFTCTHSQTSICGIRQIIIHLETLWEQSKVKKLWDDSQNKSLARLDQYLSESHPAEDSISIEDYMSRWCNIIQSLNLPTPQENHRTSHLFSLVECNNLDKYRSSWVDDLFCELSHNFFALDCSQRDLSLSRLVNPSINKSMSCDHSASSSSEIGSSSSSRYLMKASSCSSSAELRVR